MILDTNRLKTREMSQNDFLDLASMLQDDEVMYAYEHQFTDEDVQVCMDIFLQ
ncbi:hypothetical protein BN3590_02281 [Clostridium sp. C105KSO15]|nr:hypothetical protein BN3590_02281 [Clostridium sp. C105KSO15]